MWAVQAWRGYLEAPEFTAQRFLPDLFSTQPGDASVSGFAIDESGALTPVPGSPFAAGVNPASVAVAPPLGLGRFVYVANTGASTISGYSIEENGTLVPLPGFPIAGGTNVRSLAVDLFGRFLYAVNPPANNVSAYHITSDGSLIPVPGSPFSAVLGAQSVAISR